MKYLFVLPFAMIFNANMLVAGCVFGLALITLNAENQSLIVHVLAVALIWSAYYLVFKCWLASHDESIRQEQKQRPGSIIPGVDYNDYVLDKIIHFGNTGWLIIYPVLAIITTIALFS